MGDGCLFQQNLHNDNLGFIASHLLTGIILGEFPQLKEIAMSHTDVTIGRNRSEPTSKTTRVALVCLLVSVVLMPIVLLTACSNSDMARQRLKNEAEDNYGVMRTVTVYSQTGEKIESYHGKIDIAYGTDSSSSSEPTNKVDLVFFDGSEPVDRVVISGPAIVIADNDGYSEQEYAKKGETSDAKTDNDGGGEASDASKTTE